MIIGENRRKVIENIKEKAEKGEFHSTVEVNDPVLSDEQIHSITGTFLESRNGIYYKTKKFIATLLAKFATRLINKDTEIVGLEKIPGNLGGVIITSNHFSPLENTVIRHLLHKLGRDKLAIVSKASNFAMGGIIGFLMNYANTIPLSTEPRYLARDFQSVLKEKIDISGEAVLLYPEQEMWFNYRKPRPVQSGAYYFSAKLRCPVISCFVEIADLDEDDTEEFKKVKYVLHVLDVLYPDKDKSVRENTEYLSSADYALKKECYERVYGKKLTYAFEESDIAGWKEGK